jgi:hypothetical protein
MLLKEEMHYLDMAMPFFELIIRERYLKFDDAN